MYLIDQTYFTKQYNIPNLNEMDSDILSDLEQYIDKDVRSLHANALGYSLFKELDSYIVGGVLVDTAPEKWLNLVNGFEYIQDDKTVKWKGLIYEEGSSKSSLLVPYVYHNWLRDNISQVTGTGEKIIASQNAVNVSSNQRIVAAWNSFVSMYQGNECYTRQRISFVNGVRFLDWFGENRSEEISLIAFLTNKESDYPSAFKATYIKQNQLGL